jgi:hypothetical protein
MKKSNILLIVVLGLFLIILGMEIYHQEYVKQHPTGAYDRPIVGGCGGVQNIHWQECCDNYAMENNISHAQCLGNWTVENNTCTWNCVADGNVQTCKTDNDCPQPNCGGNAN